MNSRYGTLVCHTEPYPAVTLNFTEPLSNPIHGEKMKRKPCVAEKYGSDLQ